MVDTAGRLVGIISRADVLAVFDRPDEEMRAEITSQVIPRLSEPSWCSVIVKDGIVTVEGTPETVSVGRVWWWRCATASVYPVPPAVAAPGPYV